MSQLGSTSYVELPPDSTGKKAAFQPVTLPDQQTVLYVPASVVSDSLGTLVDVSAQQGSAIGLNTNDRRLQRLLGEILLEQIRTNELLTQLLEG
jgi:hypothetical protein